jgi:hypothetical protein
MCLQNKKNAGEVRGTKWSSYRNASANPFLWKPYIQEVPKCNLKIKRCSILLGQHVIRNCSNMLRYNSIHISFGERYRDVSLYKCSYPNWTTYDTCRWQFSSIISHQTPHKVVFALLRQSSMQGVRIYIISCFADAIFQTRSVSAADGKISKPM